MLEHMFNVSTNRATCNHYKRNGSRYPYGRSGSGSRGSRNHSSGGSSNSSHNYNNNLNYNDKNYIQSQSLGSRNSSSSSSSSSSRSSSIGNEELLYFHFTLDGVRIDHRALEASSNTLLHDIVELNTPLFPTVGIFSMDTRVWCRFCEADIVYRSRQAIGAIEGVRVYCLDGSVLLQDNEN